MGKLRNGLSIDGQAWVLPGFAVSAATAATVGKARKAMITVTAEHGEAGYDMISGFYVLDFGSDFFHNAGGFVTQNRMRAEGE